MHYWREDVAFLVEGGHGQHGMLGFPADHVHHVVDGDASDQALLCVDDRRRNQVVVLELGRHLPGAHIDGDHRRRLVEDSCGL